MNTENPRVPNKFIQEANYGLVPNYPQRWREWLFTRPDILEGRYAYRQLPDRSVVDREGYAVHRSVTREKRAIAGYLQGLAMHMPDYAQLVNTILEVPRSTDSIHPIRSESFRPGMAGLAAIGRLHVNPMHENCRVSVLVPARMEERGIFNMLSSYAKQTDKKGRPIDPTTWELNVLVNFKKGEQPDGTYVEVQRFMRHNPKLRVNVIEAQFRSEFSNVGNCRKVISDLTLIRALDRDKQGKYTKPLYLETEDADHVRVDHNTITNVIQNLDAEPHLDSVCGIQDRDPKALMQNDLLFMDRRLEDFMQTAGRHLAKRLPPEKRDFSWARVVTGGWNVAHTAESIALIGGWNPTLTMGEDLDIGAKTSLLRGSIRSGAFVPFVDNTKRITTRTDSSPRRFSNALKETMDKNKTINPYSGDRFADEDIERNIKGKSVADLMKRISPYARINYGNKKLFETLISEKYDKFFRHWVCKGDSAVAREYMDRIMKWLGFKEGDYVLHKKNVDIVFIENFARAMHDYRRAHARPKPVKEMPIPEAQLVVAVGPVEYVTQSSAQGYSRKTYFAKAKDGKRYVIQTGNNSRKMEAFSGHKLPERLRAHGVPVPQTKAITSEYVVTERAEGSSLNSFREVALMDENVELKHRPSTLPHLYESAGKTLRAIHEIPTERDSSYSFGPLSSKRRYDKWEDFMISQYQSQGEAIDRLIAERKIDKSTVRKVTRLLKDTYRTRKLSPVLVHGDYSDGNIVTDGSKITGVVDWELAMWGDRLYDIAWARFWGMDRNHLKKFEEGYFEGAPITQQQEKCVQAMMLSICLSQMAHMRSLNLGEWVEFLSQKMTRLSQRFC